MLFMSANWFSEKQMRHLFIEGLRNGVRGFDTAREYKVESVVSRALKDALDEVGLERKDVFIQSRVGNDEVQRLKIRDEVYRTLDRMRLSYLDCFMFHWPTPDYFLSAWSQLERVYQDEGLLRSIGMCNCRTRHLQLMIDNEVHILPQILQVEITPFWQNRDLKEFCKQHHILLQAFSPLCKMIQPIRDNEILKSLARKYQVTIPQIILRWQVQCGVSPISLSSKVDRVRSNFAIRGFELTDVDMKEIATLDCGYKYHLESATCFGY